MADYAGISYERIAKEDGVFWPCPSEDHPGTRRMFLDKFGTADGRAIFHPVQFHGSAEQPDQDYPYVLTTGRILSQYQTGAQTRRVPELCAADPDPFVEIHPDTARGLGIANGDSVRLSTRRGEAIVRARLTRDIRMDVMFTPFHWGGTATANFLTNAVLDPISRIPEFKACAVRAERVNPAKRTEVP
jgi:assimilatory nitrate reductase catalytic subunit